MAYNRINKLMMYKNVVEIVKKYYREGMSYKYVWEKHVNPVYPMSYQRFIIIVNTPNIDRAIQLEAEKVGRTINNEEDKRQLKLFPEEDNTPNNNTL